MHRAGDGTTRGQFVNKEHLERGNAAALRTIALSCAVAVALGAPYREVHAAGFPVAGAEPTTILKACTQQETTLC